MTRRFNLDTLDLIRRPSTLHTLQTTEAVMKCVDIDDDRGALRA